MLRFTLDTSSVIHAAQAQPYGPQVDELVDLARQGRVGLWITSAFTVDQETAPPDRHQRNLAWLSDRPLIGRVAGPCRRGYSRRGGPDLRTDAATSATDAALRELLLPGRATVAGRRKLSDVQHLTAHLMAGHDAFVTSDHDDLLRHRQAIRRLTGIVVVDPLEAVQLAHQPPAQPPLNRINPTRRHRQITPPTTAPRLSTGIDSAAMLGGGARSLRARGWRLPIPPAGGGAAHALGASRSPSPPAGTREGPAGRAGPGAGRSARPFAVRQPLAAFDPPSGTSRLAVTLTPGPSPFLVGRGGLAVAEPAAPGEQVHHERGVLPRG
jgi:hypothetical protein